MASKKETMEYVLDQLQALDGVFARKMFGEYSIYYKDKVVALLCDDQLFVKVTKMGEQFIQEPVYAPPYPGAKNLLLIAEEDWEDADWLCELIRITEPEVKPPKKKKPKSKA
ncbi:MAG: TfoX/Sxy family protein [Candidatus Cloacimonetes bacterium]|nr:TfoX/Sxy family protein [Candidatus Cloacimonadota bacterium]